VIRGGALAIVEEGDVDYSWHLRPRADKSNILLGTLDVRQIRRQALGKRKAPGMESNEVSIAGG
jgi:hypothetical protein